MLIAKVIGTTVSTIKNEKLTGRKLLILAQTDERGDDHADGPKGDAAACQALHTTSVVFAHSAVQDVVPPNRRRNRVRTDPILRRGVLVLLP